MGDVNPCRMCLVDVAEPPETQTLLKNIIDTLFYGKIKIEAEAELIICPDCDVTLQDFSRFYYKALDNQIQYERMLQVHVEYLDVEPKMDLNLSESDKDEGDQQDYSDFEPPDVKEDSSDELPLAARLNLPKVKKKGKEPKTPASAEEEKLIKSFYGLACQECAGLEFETLNELRYHMRVVHKVRKFHLTCCGNKYVRRCRIIDHAISHMNPEQFKCLICLRQFVDRFGLKSHMAEHEDPEARNRFICQTCGKRCTNNGNLKAHLRKHLSKQEKEKAKIFHCETCKSGFSTNAALRIHVRRTHEGYYVAVCHVCALSFTTKVNFLTHYKNVHGPKDVNRVQCQLCERWQANEQSLKKHMRAVHEPGPHICEECGREFNTRTAMKAHERYTHKMARSFECSMCTKKFKKALSLKEHMTTHLGGALYSCSYCERSFNSSANMYSHRKKMHTELWERDKKK